MVSNQFAHVQLSSPRNWPLFTIRCRCWRNSQDRNNCPLLPLLLKFFKLHNVIFAEIRRTRHRRSSSITRIEISPFSLVTFQTVHSKRSNVGGRKMLSKIFQQLKLCIGLQTSHKTFELLTISWQTFLWNHLVNLNLNSKSWAALTIQPEFDELN